LFFLDKTEDASVFVDYGCADGAMIKLAHGILPDNQYVGFDNSKEMIAAARLSCRGIDQIGFVSDVVALQKVVHEYRAADKKICLSLMSLIHEVYEYGPDTVKEFWAAVFSNDYDYIAIRDMCVSMTTSRPSDSLSVAKIRMRYDKDLLAQWEAHWGNLNENWSLVHFLLTYRYVDSWDREFRENYLPLSLENLFNLIPENWEPTYIEHYTLPFIRQQVMKDFNVDLQDRTHVKLVLKRTK
jgi:hypothetical protein